MTLSFIKNAFGNLVVALPRNTSEEEVMSAAAAILRISNQKNGHEGTCVYHEAILGAGEGCLVRALGRRVLHIQKTTKNIDAFLRSYWDGVGRGNATDSNVRYAVNFSAEALNYLERGTSLQHIDTHSL